MKCSGNESMQLWCLIALFSLFYHASPASSTSTHLRSRAWLRRKFHSRTLRPWAHGNSLGKPQEHETFSVIVWGATLWTRNDIQRNDGLFCIVRYGRPHTSWDEKLRGTSRVSNTSEPMEVSPNWNLGTLVTGTGETEISVRVLVLDEPDVAMPQLQGRKPQDKKRLLGEISVGINTLLQASHNSVDGKASFKLPGGGHVRLTARKGGGPPNFALSEYGMIPSTSYEALAAIAGQQAVRVEDINGAGPMILGTAPLPLSLRGIWWVTSPSSGSSLLLSFGGPNNDGNGCSLGYISGGKNSYKIRAEGDRVISTSEPSGMDKIVEVGDKVYYFEFDNAESPTFGRVDIVFEGLGAGIPSQWPERIMSSQMHLLPDGDTEYPGSLVWLRNTTIWGLNPMSDTKLVQVMDGTGRKLEPAWSKFLTAEKNPDNRDYAGWMFYKSVIPASSPWAIAVTEELFQRVRVHVILLMAGLLAFLCCCCTAGVYGCMRLVRTARSLDTWHRNKREAKKQNIWIH